MTDIVLVLDGDDTLWPNRWKYSDARIAFLQFLSVEFADLMPPDSLVMSRYYKFDAQLFPEQGVRRGVIRDGMQLTYDELVEWFRKQLGEDNERYKLIVAKRAEHEARIAKIGDIPFDFTKLRWMEGAKEVLLELKEDGRFMLCLLTSYDLDVWHDRGKHLGVDKFFDQVRVVPGKKTPKDFIAVSGWQEDESGVLFYAIGNGTSDILPALEISPQWRGIYIPAFSSSPVFHGDRVVGEDPYTPPPMDDPRVITLQNIKDLRSVDFERFGLKE